MIDTLRALHIFIAGSPSAKGGADDEAIPSITGTLEISALAMAIWILCKALTLYYG